MRTCLASDISLTDSTPGNTVSFFRRLHRWRRGDFQNLYFLRGGLLNIGGKLRISATAISHLVPLFALICVLVGCVASVAGNGAFVLLFAFSYLFLPFLISLFSELFSGSPFALRRFFSKAYNELVNSVLRLFYELSSSCRSAILSLHTLTLALTRLVTRKKTLEWTTAAQAEKTSSGFARYAKDGLLAAIVGACVFVFTIPPFLRLIGFIWFVYPLLSGLLSKPLPDGGAVAKPALTQRQRQMLWIHARDMWKFYDENVCEETLFLPPDNVQVAPVEYTALRTSPTNIGFYLVSLLAARDFGFINTKTLALRLSQAIGSVETLEKWRGNLFNWYDLTDGSVIGDGFVSSVDSGNFVSMLVALKEGLYEYEQEDERIGAIISRCEKLCRETDIAAFYDEKRSLFSIGFRTRDNALETNCYDMLMSEARMTGYYAVASAAVPKKHWRSLGRTLTHSDGYIGMLSWSGTAFEYLMPQLFLPLFSDSFMFESVSFALMMQRKSSAVWGRSESAYYAFDSEMHYQYKANGVQSLAIRRCGARENVISPYSTYLSLCLYGSQAIKNLASLKKEGMYGKYGMYEALDMSAASGGQSVAVQSYMAHHVGMSIVACANACFDRIFIRRFMSDNRLGSASELLQEKIPSHMHMFKSGQSRQKQQKRFPVRASGEAFGSADGTSSCLLTRNGFTAVISGGGHIGLIYGARRLVNTVFDRSSLRFSPVVLFSDKTGAYGCTPLYGASNCRFEKGDSYASHIVSDANFSGMVRYSVSRACNCFVIGTRASAQKSYDVTLAFEPVLEEAKKFYSHISLSRLFIESEYDESRKILYFHRRSSVNGEYVFTLAAALQSEEHDFSFLTSKNEYRSGSLNKPSDCLSVIPDNKTGDCLDPFCLLRVASVQGGRETFLITCGAEKSECEKNIVSARIDLREQISYRTEKTDMMLSAILFPKSWEVCRKLPTTRIGELWGRGISGDYPIILAITDGRAEMWTEELLRAFGTLAAAGIRCELVFAVAGDDGYNRSAENGIRELCAETEVAAFLGRNGGIFILRREETDAELFETIKQAAAIVLENGTDPTQLCALQSEAGDMQTVETPLAYEPLQIPDGCFASENGYFTRNGFVVDKSKVPYMPYSYVLTGHRFSCVVTQSSLGYTFFENARESRLCSFFGDPRSLDRGERLFLHTENKKYDLCACSSSVEYSEGTAHYSGMIGSIAYSVTVFADTKYPVKLMRVCLTEPDCTVSYEIRPSMGESVFPETRLAKKAVSIGGNEAALFTNPLSPTFPEGIGFAGVHSGVCNCEKLVFTGKGNDLLFFLGACKTETGAESVISKLDRRFFDERRRLACEFAKSMIPGIGVSTRSRAQDIMMNVFLPYQVAACRFYARGSFYQSGGAYGFRDQLQDCLTLVYSNPAAVRTHLLRCCAHQYTEGCVMHWWHTRLYSGVNRGTKTKCSDDMLWLPYVLTDYIEKTGDSGILDVKIRYLTSPPLKNENERYEQPLRDNMNESVYLHCLRAIAYAERTGAHGLILMGSCDWNDAFSLVGADGLGESVFSTLLFLLVMKKFIPIIESRDENETAAHYKSVCKKLRIAVESNAFAKDRYIRAFCDDGSVLGDGTGGECEIDILSQAFASLADLDPNRVSTALATAYYRLFDRKYSLLKLFTPPFSPGGAAKVGYIRGYAAGIRENGGQYTHGALWGAAGMLKSGMIEEGLSVLDGANPAVRCASRELAALYKTEPYAIAADIYSGEYGGRGGWSWYTGAASWFYRITLETVFGIKILCDGKQIDVSPLVAYRAVLKTEGGTLTVISDPSVKGAFYDGNPTELPLTIEGGDHVLTVG